jgi:hypothetical protein
MKALLGTLLGLGVVAVAALILSMLVKPLRRARTVRGIKS